MSKFNLKRYKQAFRNETPEAFIPRVDKDDPYKKTRHPGDGKGFNLTERGNQGMPGSQPDMSAPEFGRNFTEEGPEVPSAMDTDTGQDKAKARNKTPSDWDPDGPFSSLSNGDNRSTDYGTGLSTDYGQGLHDDKEPSADSPLGMHSTVMRMTDKDERDRSTPYGNMQKSNNPYNAWSQRSVFDRIRKIQ